MFYDQNWNVCLHSLLRILPKVLGDSLYREALVFFFFSYIGILSAFSGIEAALDFEVL